MEKRARNPNPAPPAGRGHRFSWTSVYPLSKPILNALLVFCLATAGLSLADVVSAASYESVTISIRGRDQSLAVYDPDAGAPGRPFQLVVTSGDLGWIGLPAYIAEHARKMGFRVVGFNARAYLSSFTGKDLHLDQRDIPGDYRTILDWVTSNPFYPRDVVFVGVSEGAGLSVLGMARQNWAGRCRGVIALGLPARTSLGWHWSDFPMWITKRDPREPQADTGMYLPELKVPLVMIHSEHDEWDSIQKAQQLFTLHPGPKRFIAVDASNHRFSDRLQEVASRIEQSLMWLQYTGPES